MRPVVARRPHTQGSWRVHDHVVDIAGDFTRDRAMVLGETRAVARAGGRSRFTLPRLGVYEVMALEPR